MRVSFDHDVEARGLTKTYGSTYAAREVSFAVRPGELLALLGPSGCGKTTTLRMIAGLIRPAAGTVHIRGRDVTRTPAHRRNVAMLFQNYALFPHMSVLDNVGFGLAMRKIEREESRRRATEALRLVKLDGYEGRMPHQLSGGQQQRVALARAMVVNPSVLLLDEPFGALDRKLRETMQIELRGLQERLAITTVLVTHDQEEALTLANQVVVMRDGEVHQIGPPDEVYERPVSRFVADFIGTSNFFAGRIEGRADGEARVRTPDGLLLRLTRLPEAAPTEGAVTVAVRPEAIRLDRGAATGNDGTNTLTATIGQVVYRGATTHLFLRGPQGQEIVVVRPTTEIQAAGGLPPPGAAVAASWEPASNCLVRED